MTVEITIRRAGPSEVRTAVEIDDASAALFRDFGIEFTVPDDHPFVVEERARWGRSAEANGMWFALTQGLAVGFYVLGRLDGRAYLDQLSVRPEYGRRGIGRALIEHACTAARARGECEILLTTYNHVPWNRAFYETVGFAVMTSEAIGPAVRGLLADQRAVLPAPSERVAMRRML